MIRHILTVSTGTLTSRMLGFVRDSMIAALLGAGAITDAFLVAFQFINVARRSLTEGALNAALVPQYLRVRETEGQVAAAAFAGRVLGSISLIFVCIAIGFAVLMPLVIALLAPGFIGRDVLQTAVNDARLMMPYFAFVGPLTVLTGVLNAEHRFTLTAFSPVLFNLTLIATLVTLLVWRHDPGMSATIIAGVVGVVGCLQMLILIQCRPFFRRSDPARVGTATPIQVSFDPQIRGFFRKAIPGMIANSGPQFLIVAGAIIASSSPAAVSWLYFANRLIELPLGMVGVAMGTVMMPELARAIQNNDHGALVKAESRGFELAVGLVMPAMLGLIVLSTPAIRVLFEHGAFTATDTQNTAMALMILAVGLPAHVLVKVISPAFFAREDTRTPLLATLAGIVVAIVASLLLGRPYGASGVAAGISLGAWSCAGILGWRVHRTFGFSLDALAERRLPRIATAAAIMGAMLYLSNYFVAPELANSGPMAQITILGGLVAAGVSFYGLLLDLFGVVNWSEALSNLRDGDLRNDDARGK